MKPRLAPLMTGVLVAVGALAACRKEVPPPPTPIPTPDTPPKPTVHTGALARAGSVVLRAR